MEPNNSPQDQIARTELLNVLASERRRNTVSYLQTCSDRLVSREEIVDVLLDCESEGAIHRERLEIDLHHVHLPKFADAGIIDYDPMSGMVEYRISGGIKTLLSRCFTLEEIDS